MRKIITALGIFFATSVVMITAVSAWHVTVTGAADCKEGVRSITWRVENSEEDAGVFNYKAHRGDAGDVVAQNTGVVLPAHHGVALVAISVDAGEYWLEVDASWATSPHTSHIGREDQTPVVATKDCEKAPVVTTRPPATTTPPTTTRPPVTTQPPTTTVPPVVTTPPPPPTTTVPPVVTTIPPTTRPAHPETLPVTGKNTKPMAVLGISWLIIGIMIQLYRRPTNG